MKMMADVTTFVIYTFVVLVCSHLQKVQAFPGDQDVHADPSCLYLPFLHQLPSHRGVQQVPTAIRHTGETIMLKQLGMYSTVCGSGFLKSYNTILLNIYVTVLISFCTYRGTSSSSSASGSGGSSWTLGPEKVKKKKQ